MRSMTSHLTAFVAGVAFIIAGVMQVAGADLPSAYFASWGYQPWVMVVVGALEVLGAVLLLAPPTRIVGGILLGVVMLGAVGTHLMNFQYDALVAPVVLGGIAAFSAYLALPKRKR